METRLVLVLISEGIPDFVEANETYLHQVLKKENRTKVCALMLQKLKDNPGKVPLQDRNEMTKLLNDTKKDVTISESSALKSVCVTNALEESEDYLVSDKIFGFVGKTMRSFRSEMIKKSPPNTIKGVIASILRKVLKEGKMQKVLSFSMEKKRRERLRKTKKSMSTNSWKPYDQTKTFLSKFGMKSHQEKPTQSLGMQFPS